jgi:hypothetical protein
MRRANYLYLSSRGSPSTEPFMVNRIGGLEHRDKLSDRLITMY